MNPEDIKERGIRVKCYDGRVFTIYHTVTIMGKICSLHGKKGEFLCSMQEVEYIESEAVEWIK